MLARAERECVIVRDHGVAVVMGDEPFATHERAFCEALGSRAREESVLAALGTMGEDIASRLPPRPDDVDELPANITVAFG